MPTAANPDPIDDPTGGSPTPSDTILDTNTRVIQGDALTALRLLDDNTVDALVTDPPYGLSKEPDATEVLTHWLNGDDYTHTSKGFMGSSWDSFVPGPAIWRETFRVLKPGAYGVVFASSRTLDLMGMSLRLAGFEIRDTLMWVGAQGFPKSLDAAKALTKAGHGDLADQFAGFGTALKPGHEPIFLVRKPLVGTVVANLVEHGTGGINIGACRVKNTTGDSSRDGEESAERRYANKGSTNFAPTPGPRGGSPEGRFPANVIFTHTEDCVEAKTVTPVTEAPTTTPPSGCADGCPIAELDTQSGIRTSGKPGIYKGTPNRSAAYGAESRQAGLAMTGFGDSGGASRFFPTFKYTQKANSRERPTVWVPASSCVAAGHADDPHDPASQWQTVTSPTETECPDCTTAIDDGTDVPTPWVPYQHSTVKPVAIMDWLTVLVCPPSGVLLDPFAGTGTTGVSALNNGFPSILVERDPTHVAMIHKRLAELSTIVDSSDPTLTERDPADVARIHRNLTGSVQGSLFGDL